MIYLDYSATTKVDEEVLNTYNEVSRNYFFNYNSPYSTREKKLALDSINQMKDILSLDNYDFIMTSSGTESNNLALKGISHFKYKRIVSTRKEHSSIKEVLKLFEDEGFDVIYLDLDENYKVDLNKLKEILDTGVDLVTISAVDSEIGVMEDISSISNLIANYDNTLFHVDATGAVGKIKIDFRNADLITFTGHKFFAPKGCSILAKKEGVNLIPLINGGSSLTPYRSGTVDLPALVSLSKALRLAYNDNDNKYNYVKELNNDLRLFFKDYSFIHINSPSNSIPYILNVSFKGVKIESFINYMFNKGVILSTKSACSSDDSYSEIVYHLTNDMNLAKTSFRISLSYKTSREEINKFKEIFKEAYLYFLKFIDNNN